MSKVVSSVSLGIDESNHGRDPEFFAGVVTGNAELAQLIRSKYFQRTLGKRKSGFPQAEWWYLKFEARDIRVLGRERLMVVAACEISKHLQSRSRNVTDIYLDGVVTEELLGEMHDRLAKVGIHVALHHDPSADVYRRLVNLADHAARGLFNAHRDGLTDVKRERRLSYDLSEYVLPRHGRIVVPHGISGQYMRTE